MIRSMTRSTLENKVNYRSLLAGNTAFSPSDYDLLETTILGSDTASVTFSSLNSTYGSTYKHLQIRGTVRGASSINTDEINMRMNLDSGSNYNSHRLRGDGSSVSSASQSLTNIQLGLISGNSATASAFASLVVDVLDPFDSSKNTTTRALIGHASTTSNIVLTSGLHRSTASLTDLEISVGEFTRSMLTGSRFSLYGIKTGA